MKIIISVALVVALILEAACAFSAPSVVVSRRHQTLLTSTVLPLAEPLQQPTSQSQTRTFTQQSTTTSNARLIESVSPLGLERTQAEYLRAVLVHLTRFGNNKSLAESIVPGLSETSANDKLKTAIFRSRLAPRVMSLVCNLGRNKVHVREDPSFGNDPTKAVREGVVDRVAYLVAQDLANVREGIYGVPFDLQLGPRYLYESLDSLAKSASFALSSYSGGNPDYESGQLKPPSKELLELSKGLELPDYYLYDFHSVPGGFLSSDHAAVYDELSETVFGGTHFMARRMLLRPLHENLRHKSGKGQRLLDIGCGNGTFLAQIQQAFPALELAGIDLSPAFLSVANDNFQKHPVFRDNSIAPTPTVQRANMEDIPADDASYDFVTCVNCFHEMPPEAIFNTVKSAARVLTKEGMFVHMDSLQMRDDPLIASQGRNFEGRFTEPFIKAWKEDIDLDAICAKAGLVPCAPARPYCASTMRCYKKL